MVGRFSKLGAPLAAACIALVPGSASAQPASQVVLYELPAYLGRSVTITKGNANLSSVNFANRAQSAKIIGEWQFCPEENFAGSCVTMTGNKKVLFGTVVVSLRTTAEAKAAQTKSSAGAAASSSSAAAASTAASSASASAAVDIEALDVDAGTEGQDVVFFARPSLGGTQVSAGTNDATAGSAFCKLAGFTSALSAGRARVQATGIIDLASKTKARAYALRDLVCKK